MAGHAGPEAKLPDSTGCLGAVENRTELIRWSRSAAYRFRVVRADVGLAEPGSAPAWLERSGWLRLQWAIRADPLRSGPRFDRLSVRVGRDMATR